MTVAHGDVAFKAHIESWISTPYWCNRVVGRVGYAQAKGIEFVGDDGGECDFPGIWGSPGKTC